MDDFFNREPVELKSVIFEIAKQLGLEDNIIQAKIAEKWVEVVGNNMAKAVIIKKFDKGTLHLTTSSSAWRTEIKLRKAAIIKLLNEKLGNIVVLELIIR